MAWDQTAFNKFVSSLELRHFRAYELLINTDRTGNELPPQEIWPNIAATIHLLDLVRAHFHRSVVINSGYRAPEYNRRVGGAQLSQHQAFTALDFSVAGVSPREVGRLLRTWRDEGKWILVPFLPERVQWEGPAGEIPFKRLPHRDGDNGPEVKFVGGIGVYNTFTHLDTRGTNANWG
jgi:hypothetical protein